MKKTSPSTNYHPPSTKVAIVADWLTNMGGAERVILQLHRAFPDAPIYTSTYEPDNMPLFKGADIRTAWFQKLPKSLRKHQLLTLPRQWYFGNLQLKEYDVVVSLSGAEAKAVRAPNGIHINLCNTPTLYYWIKPDMYLQKGGTGGINSLWRSALRVLMPAMKRWDLKAAKHPDKMYAISNVVKDRIEKYYDRQSSILYPPADIERFSNNYGGEKSGFVFFGRLVEHKKVDLAISACNEIGAKLTVIGNGPELERLKNMSGPTITFKQNVPDNEMVDYIAKAEAFIFPNEEDFGIVAVEAQAAGIPVIAYRAGGSLDTVVEGVTGEFFDDQSTESLAKKLEEFNYKLYNKKAIVAQAEKFSNEVFQKNIQRIVQENTK